jgi:hypothetical protein
MTSNASVRALNRWFVNVGVGLGLVLSFALASLAFAPTAAAQEAAPPPAAAQETASAGMLGAGMGQGFGAQGQITINGDLSTGLTKFKGGGWAFSIQPAADYFVLPNVSAGLLLGYARDSNKNSSFAARPRVGYALSFTDHVGIWPHVGVSVIHNSPGNPALKSATGSTFDIDLPIMIHIVPHLFFGVGPDYHLKLSNATTNYGFFSMVGGWF